MMLKIYMIFFFLILHFLLCEVEPVGDEVWIASNKFQILIPQLPLDANICTGNREDCLQSTAWLKKRDSKGNILLTGHSFNILPLQAGPFYGLWNLEMGDRVYLKLEKSSVFEVYEVFVTNRYDLSVEDFSDFENTLVLYSCYPIWSASERIVVRARLCDLCENEI